MEAPLFPQNYYQPNGILQKEKSSYTEIYDLHSYQLFKKNKIKNLQKKQKHAQQQLIVYAKHMTQEEQSQLIYGDFNQADYFLHFGNIYKDEQLEHHLKEGCQCNSEKEQKNLNHHRDFKEYLQKKNQQLKEIQQKYRKKNKSIVSNSQESSLEEIQNFNQISDKQSKQSFIPINIPPTPYQFSHQQLGQNKSYSNIKSILKKQRSNGNKYSFDQLQTEELSNNQSENEENDLFNKPRSASHTILQQTNVNQIQYKQGQNQIQLTSKGNNIYYKGNIQNQSKTLQIPKIHQFQDFCLHKNIPIGSYQKGDGLNQKNSNEEIRNNQNQPKKGILKKATQSQKQNMQAIVKHQHFQDNLCTTLTDIPCIDCEREEDQSIGEENPTFQEVRSLPLIDMHTYIQNKQSNFQVQQNTAPKNQYIKHQKPISMVQLDQIISDQDSVIVQENDQCIANFSSSESCIQNNKSQ